MDSRAAGTLKTKSASGLLMPFWALLMSVVLHALLLGCFGGSCHLPSWLRARQERLVVKLIPQHGQSEQPASITLVKHAQDDLAPPVLPATQAISEKVAPAPQPPASNASPQDTDDGYLPSEFLSQTAIPTSDIDLQDIASPEAPGRLQLLLWINKAGEVTKVDVELTEAPQWFSAQVIDRFKQAPFVPGQRDNKPEASLMRIEVSF
jgi:hypothetical protein